MRTALSLTVAAMLVACSNPPRPAPPARPPPAPQADNCSLGDREDCARRCKSGAADACARLVEVVAKNFGASQDARGDATLFVAFCDRGDARACELAAVAYARGAGVTVDVDAAEKFAKRGCDGGAARACFALAGVRHARTGTSEASLDERACAGGDMRACASPEGRARSLAAASQSCSAGDAFACRDVGEALADSREVASSRRGLEALQRACDDDVYAACTKLAASLVASNPERARLVASTTCAHGDPEACILAARSRKEGEDPRALFARAKDLRDRMCDGGDAGACLTLANDAWRGEEGVERDAANAEGYFRRACDARLAIACHGLGQLLAGGGDRASTVEAFRAACELGVASDCELEARELAEIDDASAQRARELAAKACDARIGSACSFAALLYAMGRGGSSEPGRALDLDRRACTLGDVDGCVMIARIEPSREEARSSAAKACATREAACVERAILDGRAKAPPAAFTPLLASACAKGDATSCHLLAAFERGGAANEHERSACFAADIPAQTWSLAPDVRLLGCERHGALLPPRTAEQRAAAATFRCVVGDAASCSSDEIAKAVAACESAENVGPRARRSHRVDCAISGSRPKTPEADRLPALELACDGGHVRSCTLLGKILLRRRDADHERGARMLQRSCDLHDPVACAATSGPRR